MGVASVTVVWSQARRRAARSSPQPAALSLHRHVVRWPEGDLAQSPRTPRGGAVTQDRLRLRACGRGVLGSCRAPAAVPGAVGAAAGQRPPRPSPSQRDGMSPARARRDLQPAPCAHPVPLMQGSLESHPCHPPRERQPAPRLCTQPTPHSRGALGDASLYRHVTACPGRQPQFGSQDVRTRKSPTSMKKCPQ